MIVGNPVNSESSCYLGVPKPQTPNPKRLTPNCFFVDIMIVGNPVNSESSCYLGVPKLQTPNA
jgi:hypothetical protein